MALRSLRFLKSLLCSDRSLMHSSNCSRHFLLSSIRAPLYLHESNLNSRLVLQSTKLNRSLFIYPVSPYIATSLMTVSVSIREPRYSFMLNCVKSAWSRSVLPVVCRRTVHTSQLSKSGNPVMLERKRENELQQRLILLREKLLKAGIRLLSYKPGQYDHNICPQCLGGLSQAKSLSVLIDSHGDSAVWMCFRAKCGWTGSARPYADGSTKNRALKENGKKVEKHKQPRKITEQELELEPLCQELVAYFESRGISAETLRRNHVMQRSVRDVPAIAFTYQWDGTLITCKYRQSPKTFWQEAGTEKIFYGLDDIKNERDIIIVEGEIDKLSMEEAGFKNCVSVPHGAPSSVSKNEIPSEEEASRIILATDADGPGQALAEELARRLGKERCWRVKWPMKDDGETFKDANEVLFYNGKEALREVVRDAEMYAIRAREPSQRQLRDDVSRMEQQIMSALSSALTNIDNLNRHLTAKDEEIAHFRDEIRILSAHSVHKTKELESQLEEQRRVDQELKKKVLEIEFCLQESQSQMRKLQILIERDNSSI